MNLQFMIINGHFLSPFLKNLRNKSGLTQAQVAEKMGVTQAEVSRIEKSKRTIRPETVKKICDVYGMTLEEFETKFVDYVENTERMQSKETEHSITDNDNFFVKKTDYLKPIDLKFKKGEKEECLILDPIDTKEIIIDYENCKVLVVKKNNTEFSMTIK